MGAYEYTSGGTQTGPTAALTVSPASGTAPIAVTADASHSAAGSSPITSYTFSFGDGSTLGPQPGATASHTYQSAGNYQVTVTATDGNGLTSQATQAVTVSSQASGPTAALTVSPASGTAPLAVTADASHSGAGSSPITSYTFSFGDGSTLGPQPGATASHTYQSAGNYQVTVTATDGNGLTSQATQAVTVSPPATTAAKYVNQIATNYSTSSHTSGYVTVWRAGGVEAGDLIIATVQLTGTSAAGAVSGADTVGDVLNVVSDVSDGNGDRLVTLAGVAPAGLPVNDQVLLKFPTAASYRITADEVAGVSAVDQVAAASGSSTAFSSGATGTTARAGEFVYAAVATFGSTSVGWGPGWTGLATYSVGSNSLGMRLPDSFGHRYVHRRGNCRRDVACAGHHLHVTTASVGQVFGDAKLAGLRAPSGGRVFTDPPVDRFAQQVGVAGVPAILLDQVADQPAQAGVVAGGSRRGARTGQVRRSLGPH